jgi:hypothetical protein
LGFAFFGWLRLLDSPGLHLVGNLGRIIGLEPGFNRPSICLFGIHLGFLKRFFQTSGSTAGRKSS